MTDSLMARFWAKVDKTDTCWLWTASQRTNGYGQFAIKHGQVVYAHRFAYEALVGPIPVGLQIDHLCRVRHCVNPSHMEPVTPRENTLRGYGISVINAAKTHCPQGHLYDARRQNGDRRCRTCNREEKRRQKLRRSAA